MTARLYGVFTRFFVTHKEVNFGHSNKMLINEDMQITEWSPDVFAYLRTRDGYTNQILYDSLRPEANKKKIL